MGHSKRIKKEKKKIDKLAHFCSKVNTFINTRLTNQDTASLLDTVDKINHKLMSDTDFLKNLESNELNPSNSALYNSPFLPGHTFATNGKKSIPVANPLGTAALGMSNTMNPLSMSAFSLTDPIQAQSQNILNRGPPISDDAISVMGYSPMMINNQPSPAPPVVYPSPIVHSRKTKHAPVHIPQPVFSPGGPIMTPVVPALAQIPTPIPAVGASSMLVTSPGSPLSLTIN